MVKLHDLWNLMAENIYIYMDMHDFVYKYINILFINNILKFVLYLKYYTKFKYFIKKSTTTSSRSICSFKIIC